MKKLSIGCERHYNDRRHGQATPLLSSVIISRIFQGLKFFFPDCYSPRGYSSFGVAFGRARIIARIVQRLFRSHLVDIFDPHSLFRQDCAAIVADFGEATSNKYPIRN